MARLKALPAAGRFRNSLFGGALQDEIERLLSEPGSRRAAGSGPASAAARVLEPGVLGDDVVHAGAGGRVAKEHREVAERYEGLLGGVNPLQGTWW